MPPLGFAKGGHFEVMVFLECSVIVLFEAFYMFRDHDHVKMKF